jgi:cytochrome c biogenesis protein CcmG/thiol:disulfide interchange protein DsbE
MNKKRGPFLAAVFLAAAASLGLAERPGIEGETVEFALKDLDGREVQLSDFQGKVVLVNFWATWCAPCREEIPHFQFLLREYRSRGLEVIGIALDEEGISAVKPFVEEEGITYLVLIGDDEVVRAFGGIRYMPTTFLIDRSGRVVKKYFGAMRRNVLEEGIMPLI